MTEKPARDEGAEQTKIIIDAVKRARIAKHWSAAQLAEEMTKAGIPWNGDVIANLENGRRKSLRVHELLTLMYVLEVKKPLDLLIPGPGGFPVIPGLRLGPGLIRAWLRGEIAPLRQTVDNTVIGKATAMLQIAELFEEAGQTEQAADTRRLAALIPGDDNGAA